MRSKEERIKDMNAVIGEIRMEGFEFEPNELERLTRLANGDLTHDQARAEVMNEIEERKKRQ